MSYQKEKLELLAGGGAGARIWAYQSSDDVIDTITTDGYFPITSNLRVNDLIYINSSDKNGFTRVYEVTGETIKCGSETAIA